MRKYLRCMFAAASFLSAPTFAEPAWQTADIKPAELTASTWRLKSAALTASAWQSGDTKSAALKWEIGYLALSALDTAQTINCLHRDTCDEGNPLFGKHPSAGKLILAKAGFDLIHFVAFNHINDRNPKAALRLAQVSFALQGSVVLLNARLTFK